MSWLPAPPRLALNAVPLSRKTFLFRLGGTLAAGGPFGGTGVEAGVLEAPGAGRAINDA